MQSIARGNAKLGKVLLIYPKFAILCNYNMPLQLSCCKVNSARGINKKYCNFAILCNYMMHRNNRKYCKRTQSLQYFAIIICICNYRVAKSILQEVLTKNIAILQYFAMILCNEIIESIANVLKVCNTLQL